MINLDNFNNLLSKFIYVAIFIYIYSIQNSIPPYIKNLFNNPIFRILILALITYISVNNITLALIIAFAYIYTFNLLQKNETTETFEQVKKYIYLESLKNVIN